MPDKLVEHQGGHCSWRRVNGKDKQSQDREVLGV